MKSLQKVCYPLADPFKLILELCLDEFIHLEYQRCQQRPNADAYYVCEVEASSVCRELEANVVLEAQMVR